MAISEEERESITELRALVGDQWKQLPLSAVSPAPSRHRWLKRVGVVILAILTYLWGAVSPVTAPIVSKSVVMPLVKILKPQPLTTDASIYGGRGDCGAATFGGVASSDDNLDYSEWLAETGPKTDSIPSQPRLGIYQQASVYLKLRSVSDQAVVVERVYSESSNLDQSPLEWVVPGSNPGCGGDGGVDLNAFKLNLDESKEIIPNYAKSTNINPSSGKFVIPPDAPTDVIVDVRSCNFDRRVSIFVDYSIRGIEYSRQELTSFVIYSGVAKEWVTSEEDTGMILTDTNPYEAPCDESSEEEGDV